MIWCRAQAKLQSLKPHKTKEPANTNFIHRLHRKSFQKDKASRALWIIASRAAAHNWKDSARARIAVCDNCTHQGYAAKRWAKKWHCFTDNKQPHYRFQNMHNSKKTRHSSIAKTPQCRTRTIMIRRRNNASDAGTAPQQRHPQRNNHTSFREKNIRFPRQFCKREATLAKSRINRECTRNEKASFWHWKCLLSSFVEKRTQRAPKAPERKLKGNHNVGRPRHRQADKQTNKQRTNKRQTK